ncbi:MAG: preprotein translocase subunit SecG [Phycisphaerales bacterium]
MITIASQQLWIGLGIVGFLFVSLTMILIVLIQKPQGGGLSGAFGASSDGGGSGQTAFGAKTGDVLTTLTIAIFIIFLVSAAGLNFLIRPPAPVEVQPELTSDEPVPRPAQQPAGGGDMVIETDRGQVTPQLLDGPPAFLEQPVPQGDTPPGSDPETGDPQPIDPEQADPETEQPGNAGGEG